MTIDLRPVPAAEPPTPREGYWLIRSGAELVHLSEQLYVRFIRLVLVLMLVGCGLSISFGSLSSQGSPGRPFTLLFAALGAVFSAVGLTRPGPVYCWLRYSRVRQLVPAAIAALIVAVNGPNSPSWWVALPLLWVVAVVSSTRIVFAGALVTAVAYIAGTLLGGKALIHDGDASTLAAAVGLPVNTMVGRFAAEVFARFVLRLHQLERQLADRIQPPIPVPNLAPPTPAEPALPATRPRAQPASGHDRPHVALRLTARQLEAALLARDGLRQSEIAICLGISPRQVERLLHDARQRAGAQTTSQLVAMLVAAQLAPDTSS